MTTMTAPAKPALCSCPTEVLEPNAEPTTPYFDGIRRFPSLRYDFQEDCLEHGYMFRVNVAALIRYSD